MAEKRDYYEVLGVAKTATADEIKLAYRKAAMKWHPDRWVEGTDAEKKTAEEKFKEASEAYSVLSDPDKKARYDQFGMEYPADDIRERIFDICRVSLLRHYRLRPGDDILKVRQERFRGLVRRCLRRFRRWFRRVQRFRRVKFGPHTDPCL